MIKETTTNIFYVYIHTFTNGAVYIGKGKDKRAYSFSNRNKVWENHANKYGNPIVKLLFTDLDEELSFLVEVEMIDKYRQYENRVLNLTLGGEGVSGYVASPELIATRNEAIRITHNKEDVKLKVSLASKKAHSNPNTKKKHRDAIIKAHTTVEARALKSFYAKGRIQSDDTKKKRSISMTGRKLSETHIINMSGLNHHSIDKREFKFIHHDIGEVVATQSYMLREYGCKASHLILGRSKTSKGWSLSGN